MLAQYRRKGNIAAGVWLASILPFVAFVAIADDLPQFAQGIIQLTLIILLTGSYWYACWAFAKAKGYSGFVGLMLPIFSILGLIVLIALRDKHKIDEPPDVSPAP